MRELVQDLFAQEEPVCVGARGADFTGIPTSATSIVTWTSSVWDPWNMHDPAGAVPGRFVIPTAMRGWFVVVCSVYWYAMTPPAGARRELWISKNSVIVRGSYSIIPASAQVQGQLSVGVVNLEPSDYVDARVWHDMGAANTIAYDHSQMALFPLGRRGAA